MRKSELTKEADSFNRKGSSALYKEEKVKKSVTTALLDTDVKSAAMDYIFGKTDENPLAEFRK